MRQEKGAVWGVGYWGKADPPHSTWWKMQSLVPHSPWSPPRGCCRTSRTTSRTGSRPPASPRSCRQSYRSALTPRVSPGTHLCWCPAPRLTPQSVSSRLAAQDYELQADSYRCSLKRPQEDPAPRRPHMSPLQESIEQQVSRTRWGPLDLWSQCCSLKGRC